eukprot:3982008-Alexandrium_andersonii.AAC.1
MSASLVGSEMCIRDRSPGSCPRARWKFGSATCSSGPCCSRMCWRSAAPVSYTHLTLPTICSV